MSTQNLGPALAALSLLFFCMMFLCLLIQHKERREWVYFLAGGVMLLFCSALAPGWV
jgi:hypothetical protein